MIRGYALDMKPSGFGLIALGYHAVARHADPLTDKLYLVLDVLEEPTVTYAPAYSTIPTIDSYTIFQFDGDESSALVYRWRGKLNVMSRSACMQVCRVQADDYVNLTMRLYGDGDLVYETLVTDDEIFTLPTDDEVKTYEFELIGTSRVRWVKIAETIDEILRDG